MITKNSWEGIVFERQDRFLISSFGQLKEIEIVTLTPSRDHMKLILDSHYIWISIEEFKQKFDFIEKIN